MADLLTKEIKEEYEVLLPQDDNPIKIIYYEELDREGRKRVKIELNYGNSMYSPIVKKFRAPMNKETEKFYLTGEMCEDELIGSLEEQVKRSKVLASSLNGLPRHVRKVFKNPT